MKITTTPILRWTALLGLGALLLSSAPADAKPKGHGKGNKKWQKHYDKRERKEEKRWAKQERKEAKRWEKANRDRDDWEQDRWDDRDYDRNYDLGRSSTGGSEWWQDLLSNRLRR